MSSKRVLRKVYYALLLARFGGPGGLLRLFGSRVHSTVTYVWLARELGSAQAPGSAQVPFTLQAASREAFTNMLTGLKAERGQDVFEILRRISFHGRGFESCYLATTDTGEICHMAWLLCASHNGLIASQYPSGTTGLNEGEALLENIFTFPRYRGKGVMTGVTAQLANLAREQGFRRLLAYVDVENKGSLRAFHRAGFHPCGEETEQWRFFRNKRSGRGGR